TSLNKKKSGPGKLKKHLVHLFILPAFLLYGIFQFYPLVSAAWNSLYSFNGFEREQFIGVENFIRLFTEEPYKKFFFNAFKHNWIYFFVTVFTQLLISLLLATIIHSKI